MIGALVSFSFSFHSAENNSHEKPAGNVVVVVAVGQTLVLVVQFKARVSTAFPLAAIQTSD